MSARDLAARDVAVPFPEALGGIASGFAGDLKEKIKGQFKLALSFLFRSISAA
jgi:hypothetical protein